MPDRGLAGGWRPDTVDLVRTGATQRSILVAGMLAALAAATPHAQTAIKLAKNNYTLDDDVRLGREAADQVRRQYPIVRDERIARYLTTLGDRLVAAAPPELNQPVYEYSFTAVNLKEINAFALPGGPMFVNRGMFDAAESEAEVAGVMAHELSHVLLRHGTANATKAQNPLLGLGQLAGILAGRAVGGPGGSAIMQTTQLGLGSVLLKYSREFEKEADLLGAQIMARAGYDPRALAHMFETIAHEAAASGSGAPEWLSGHPDPGNRTQYILREAESLTVAKAADTSDFAAIKSVFASSLPRAQTMADLARAGRDGGSPDAPAPSVGTPGEPLPHPSSEYKPVRGGRVFEASVPADWTTLTSNSSIRAAPRNGYGDVKGQTVFTCGVEFGVTRAATRDLESATDAFVDAIARNNPGIHESGAQKATVISQRSTLMTPLVNESSLGGQEHVVVYTTLLRDGGLFYYLTVVPESDAATFEDAFRRVAESIHLTDSR